MTKTDPNKKFTFNFDEQGANTVNEQIMDSYNSGFIDQETAVEKRDQDGETAG
ncbi:MAG TPA: hypothetical protein VGI04_11850 [Neobacillus sp.]